MAKGKKKTTALVETEVTSGLDCFNQLVQLVQVSNEKNDVVGFKAIQHRKNVVTEVLADQEKATAAYNQLLNDTMF